jgi:transcriptional regulator with XRE-family HTH domain
VLSIAIAINLYITFVIMKTLAERLTWARTEAKITQQELARGAGVAQSTIASWESGARATGRKITVIAAYLGVDPIWLLDGKGVPTKNADGAPANDTGSASSEVAPKDTKVLHLVAEPDDRVSPEQLRKWMDFFLNAEPSRRPRLIVAVENLVSRQESSANRNKR